MSMIFLENFLLCLKGLPNDLQRNLALLHVIDQKCIDLKARIKEKQDEILRLANSGDVGKLKTEPIEGGTTNNTSSTSTAPHPTSSSSSSSSSSSDEHSIVKLEHPTGTTVPPSGTEYESKYDSTTSSSISSASDSTGPLLDSTSSHTNSAQPSSSSSGAGGRTSSTGSVAPSVIGTPTLEQILELRRLQAESHALHQEKIALANQAREIVNQYSLRIDDDLKKMEELLDPDVLVEPMEVIQRKKPEKRKAVKQSVGSPRNSSSSDIPSFKEKSNSLSSIPSITRKNSVPSSLSSSSSTPTIIPPTSGNITPTPTTITPTSLTTTMQNIIPNNLPTNHTNANNNNNMGNSNGGIGEKTYCVCKQISFGEMIACDNSTCPVEWFHFNCVGLKRKPKGKWYCDDCKKTRT